MNTYAVGIDIGSTSAKITVFHQDSILTNFMIPTGWNSRETAEQILETLSADGIGIENSCFLATGYGRISVPYAFKTVTEITCHGLGAWYLHQQDATVIDIGGQDTKIIELQQGTVKNFYMNDKCSAGTGRFVEIMANAMGIKLDELFLLAEKGNSVPISSMCTVFAESEVISHIAAGKKREDIASGIIDSVISKVCQLAAKGRGERYVLTGGFSRTPYILYNLEKQLGAPVTAHELGQYAGSIGAALLAQKYM